MNHLVKQLLYKIGRRLMHLNYIPDCDAVEHDLRLEVQELRAALNKAQVSIAVLKVKCMFHG